MEEGTHRELLGRNGAYARLFELQSRYYRKGRSTGCRNGQPIKTNRQSPPKGSGCAELACLSNLVGAVS